MTSDDHRLAHDLAERAGQRLLARRAAGGTADELRRDGDRQSHEYILSELTGSRPADAVLSEEGADSAARLSADRVWIVDPLDGTREFGEQGRTDWAVHIALWERGELTAGAVALPAQGHTLSTAAPPAGPAGGAGQGGRLRILVSRTRPAEFMQRLADEVSADLIPLGSAGAKAAGVIRGDADAYVHAGGQYEWDSAAPVAVAWAAGLHASRIDGSKLAYNQPTPSVPDILICRAALADLLLGAISSVRQPD
ncbi:MAG TPA: 3'(2'),5'-bisphosphate nucleotidase CysQ [Streptosporangiaceae bacterium]